MLWDAWHCDLEIFPVVQTSLSIRSLPPITLTKKHELNKYDVSHFATELIYRYA